MVGNLSESQSEGSSSFQLILDSFLSSVNREQKRGQDSIFLPFSLVSAKLRACLEPNESVLPVRYFMC